jgi:hypothetical protein
MIVPRRFGTFNRGRSVRSEPMTLISPTITRGAARPPLRTVHRTRAHRDLRDTRLSVRKNAGSRARIGTADGVFSRAGDEPRA